jgi:DNA-damage-inducible protein J
VQKGGMFMKGVNVTVRLDEDTKKEFDSFCDNVGINITTAFNMFIKVVLRNRALPFPVTDRPSFQDDGSLISAFREAQEQAVTNGTSDMSMDEINKLIAESRKGASTQ